MRISTFQTFMLPLHSFSNYILFLIDMNNQHLDYRSDNANYQTMENELYLKDYVIILRIHLKKIIMIFLIAFSFGFILHLAKYLNIGLVPLLW